MRTKRSSNSNMRFLKGNVLFFALLLFAIIAFAYYSFGEIETGAGESASCRISFCEEFAGDVCEVFVDDSLLYAGAPLSADTVLVMKRFATPNSSVSLYTSKSSVKVVAGGDTVARVLQGDRIFCIATSDGKVVIDAVDAVGK